LIYFKPRISLLVADRVRMYPKKPYGRDGAVMRKKMDP
jgi:hypothetical protein